MSFVVLSCSRWTARRFVLSLTKFAGSGATLLDSVTHVQVVVKRSRYEQFSMISSSNATAWPRSPCVTASSIVSVYIFFYSVRRKRVIPVSRRRNAGYSTSPKSLLHFGNPGIDAGRHETGEMYIFFVTV